MQKIILKRIYDEPSETDGYRILIDRLWPRGISKEQAKLDEWLKEIAPSNELRKWFHHQPERFQEFTDKYKMELLAHQTELLRLKTLASKQKICLLYGAKDEVNNQAVILKSILETM